MGAPRVIGRLAPSPNGALHLGHATSFLAAWWSSRRQGGKVILRLEDVDVDRAGEEHIQRALEDLRWLGMDWDGPLVIQSTRTGRTIEAAEALLTRRLAYPCTCSRGDLARARTPEETKGAPQEGVTEGRYPGTCRDLGRWSLSEAEEHTGKPAGLRFLVPPGIVTFDDGIFGSQGFDVGAEVGDFLILRRNKTPAYQLAVVVDDDRDGVSEVVRGRDLLPSTARQILLSEALGLARPRTFHLPLVCDHTGRRISKRQGDLGLVELRKAGVDAARIVGWAAQALGVTHERRSGLATEFTADYAPEKIKQADIILPERIAECFA